MVSHNTAIDAVIANNSSLTVSLPHVSSQRVPTGQLSVIKTTNNILNMGNIYKH